MSLKTISEIGMLPSKICRHLLWLQQLNLAHGCVVLCVVMVSAACADRCRVLVMPWFAGNFDDNTMPSTPQPFGFGADGQSTPRSSASLQQPDGHPAAAASGMVVSSVYTTVSSSSSSFSSSSMAVTTAVTATTAAAVAEPLEPQPASVATDAAGMNEADAVAAHVGESPPTDASVSPWLEDDAAAIPPYYQRTQGETTLMASYAGVDVSRYTDFSNESGAILVVDGVLSPAGKAALFGDDAASASATDESAELIGSPPQFDLRGGGGSATPQPSAAPGGAVTVDMLTPPSPSVEQSPPHDASAATTTAATTSSSDSGGGDGGGIVGGGVAGERGGTDDVDGAGGASPSFLGDDSISNTRLFDLSATSADTVSVAQPAGTSTPPAVQGAAATAAAPHTDHAGLDLTASFDALQPRPVATTTVQAPSPAHGSSPNKSGHGDVGGDERGDTGGGGIDSYDVSSNSSDDMLFASSGDSYGQALAGIQHMIESATLDMGDSTTAGSPPSPRTTHRHDGNNDAHALYAPQRSVSPSPQVRQRRWAYLVLLRVDVYYELACVSDCLAVRRAVVLCSCYCALCPVRVFVLLLFDCQGASPTEHSAAVSSFRASMEQMIDEVDAVATSVLRMSTSSSLQDNAGSDRHAPQESAAPAPTVGDHGGSGDSGDDGVRDGDGSNTNNTRHTDVHPDDSWEGATAAPDALNASPTVTADAGPQNAAGHNDWDWEIVNNTRFRCVCVLKLCRAAPCGVHA